MKTIFKGNPFSIVWNIIDRSTNHPFEFTGMKVEVGLYSDSFNLPLQSYNVNNGTITAEIEANTLPAGVFNIMCRYSTDHEQSYCTYRNAFQISIRPCHASEIVEIESYASHIDPSSEDPDATDYRKCQLIAEELFGEKLHLPELTADRTIADEHGNRIVDTYVTRNGLTNHIKETYNQQFNENPPLIMYGYITPEMLSEETRQMLEATGQEITNLPDGEDLASIHGVLKFANKHHNPNSYSGLGRQYLRKNIVAGVNILTQSMMQWPNTIYIIQYDYDLQGKEITIPEDCVLDFQGGSISNGTVNGHDFTIVANDKARIFYNVSIGGCSKVYAAWFGVSPDNEDNSPYISQALKNPSLTYSGNRTIVFGDGIFKIKKSVEISSANIVGSTPVNKLNGNKDVEYKTIFQLEGDCPLFTVYKTNDMLYSIATTYMENCMMRCMSKTEYPNSIGIDTHTATLKMKNCEIYGFVKGLNAYALISSELDKVDFAYNTTAIYFASKGANISTSTWFRRCYIYESGIHFKNEANSVLDCHFNACIFESAKTKSMEINPYGFVVMHLTDCYSENNRTKDYELSKYDIEVLPVTLTDNIYFKLLSVGNIWAGQNFGVDKWGTFIKVNAGTFYSYGDTYTRYNYAMEIDDTTAAKINVDFNSHIFSGPIAALDEGNSKMSIARTNLYIHTVAGDGREVQTSVPQVNLQLRDGAYPKIGISAERDVALQRKAICMKSENNGVVRVYDNHLLAIGSKIRVGNASNAISLPLKDSINVLAASPKQAFLSVGKSESGAIVPYLSYSTDKDAEFTNVWSNKIIPLFDQVNGIPSASTNLPEALFRFDRKNGGLYAYSHFWGRNVNVMDGYPPVLRKGNFDEKPEPSALLDGMDYYCTDRKKKILCNGTEWVNMDGTSLDD